MCMRFIAWGVERDIEKNKGGLREGGRRGDKIFREENKLRFTCKEEGLMKRMREGGGEINVQRKIGLL